MRSIFCANFEYETRQSDFERLFEKYGRVDRVDMKSDIMEAVKKEAVDLETIPIEEIYENLRCSKDGLSSEDAKKRLEIFGYNKLEEKKGKPPDWQDFVGIITLLVINSTISFIEENNVGYAAAALMACLAPKAKVL
ncbi:hypothetical protein L2E82_48998 [Cichorium intybus]|uniref:Uncharacterized protein n=1 Tax=Cichorium intybus TaxID=13427 RepID=A0ACB8Z3F1_CICIN|nr:hypothetical protein L2E82_48998 [Cichorium intybus]